jgi:dTDP-4-dehydrorhamnose reductase
MYLVVGGSGQLGTALVRQAKVGVDHLRTVREFPAEMALPDRQ